MCGASAIASLTMDDSGNLYGTTLCGGSNHFGNVFKLTNTQGGWQYTSLYDFTGSADGPNPISNVTFGPDGTLYGTAENGGSGGYGTVWMIKP